MPDVSRRLGTAPTAHPQLPATAGLDGLDDGAAAVVALEPVAPAIAPAVLAIGGGSYGLLYAVAGVCAIIGAFTILPVKAVR